MFGTQTTRTYNGRVLKSKQTPTGYRQVSLNDGSKRVTINIHRVVAREFLQDFCERLEVNHKDGDKSNNDVSNLEMLTSSGNKKHAYDTGLREEPLGEKASNFKGVVEVINKEGVVVDTLIGYTDTINKGYSACGVSSVITGRQKTHKGYYFRRIDND